MAETPTPTPTPAAPAPTAPPPSSPPINTPFEDLDAALNMEFSNTFEPKGEPEAEAAPAVPPPASAAAKPSPKPSTSLNSSKEEASPTPSSGKEKSAPDATKTSKALPAPELRKAYEELKAKHKALEAEHGALKNKPPAEDPEKKELLSRTEQLSKRAQELEEKLKFKDYSESDEFKAKYQQPFEEAYRAGATKAMGLRVTDADGNIRQATQQDFDRIMQATNEEDAVALAQELFGEGKSNLVLWHRENILSKHLDRVRALEDFKKTAADRSKQDMETRQKRSQAMEEAWRNLNQEAKTKYPHYFSEQEGDEEGNLLLKDGYNRYNAVFNGGVEVDENGLERRVTDEEMVVRHSEALNKAAAFNRLARSRKLLEARVKELETELEQFKASEPKTAEGGKQEGDEGEEDMFAGIEKYAINI